MTSQFPPLQVRASLPDWPRLMAVDLAAAYLGIGESTLRSRGPKPKKIGSRTLYDKQDLDRWADGLGGQPLDADDARSHAGDVERAWFEQRDKRDKGNG